MDGSISRELTQKQRLFLNEPEHLSAYPGPDIDVEPGDAFLDASQMRELPRGDRVAHDRAGELSRHALGMEIGGAPQTVLGLRRPDRASVRPQAAPLAFPARGVVVDRARTPEKVAHVVGGLQKAVVQLGTERGVQGGPCLIAGQAGEKFVGRKVAGSVWFQVVQLAG